MTSALLRYLSLIVVVLIASSLRAQAPTPFGTPSLLPIQGSNTGQMPAYTAPHSMRSALPPSPAAFGQVPSTTLATVTMPVYPSTGIPSQYMAAQVPTPAPPTLPSTQDMRSAEPLPGSRGTVPTGPDGTTHDALGAGSSDCCWGEPACDFCCDPCCGPSFYAGVGALMLTRNDPRFSQISFDDTNLVGQVLSTDTGLGQWDPGAMIQFGWYLNPCWAVEVTYWGIYDDPVETTVYAGNLVGNLNSALDFSPLNIGATNVNTLYDAAAAHRIRRSYEVHNVEVNLLGGRVPGMGCGGFQVSYLAGFRYLRFTEDFSYASADTNPLFGADPANEAYYDIAVRNNLWGFQLGGRADWFITPRFSLYTAPKFGLYANYMEHRSRIYNATGLAVVGPGNPLAGGVYDIASDNTIASFVGELDLGLSYQFTCCLGASVGYRALAVNGLAYATDQIPGNFADLPGVATIDSNASLLLHGGYAAITLSW